MTLNPGTKLFRLPDFYLGKNGFLHLVCLFPSVYFSKLTDLRNVQNKFREEKKFCMVAKMTEISDSFVSTIKIRRLDIIDKMLITFGLQPPMDIYLNKLKIRIKNNKIVYICKFLIKKIMKILKILIFHDIHRGGLQTKCKNFFGGVCD